MFSGGRYVRAPPDTTGSDSDDSLSNEAGVDRFIRAPYMQRSDIKGENGIIDNDFDYHSSTGPDSWAELEARVRELENVIKNMRDANRTPQASRQFNGPGQRADHTVHQTHIPSTSGRTIRWNNIKPFPKNVGATKMWESWTRFLEVLF